MSTEKLTFDPFATAPEPSPDLWGRIAQAHLARRTRRRRLRIGGGASAALAVMALALLLPLRAPVTTDWQARAQALEIELRALPPRTVGTDDPAALEAESRLVQIDGALQAAYDRGARPAELVPLWKARSELLSTLLTVRQENVAVTRI